MKSLLVTNIKGGVAKSSTAVAIATGLKLQRPESRVLRIQGVLTVGSPRSQIC